MRIGEAARESGVNAKMIRHYESIGLVTEATRSLLGYRNYDEDDVYVLKFIKRARMLGFSMSEIKNLLDLWKNKDRTNKEVHNLTSLHIQTLEQKISELQQMIDSLKYLVKSS